MERNLAEGKEATVALQQALVFSACPVLDCTAILKAVVCSTREDTRC